MKKKSIFSVVFSIGIAFSLFSSSLVANAEELKTGKCSITIMNKPQEKSDNI
ncbi:hypothetical protein [Aeribacillus alveayuensis]|uniref:Uncharacterized protein n=1 Tax=Aeribacillus alveayuensis TaxID=279215 RepID=A0ABT9VSE7_9BACI|nr:hypothetical protein [Bacillus alveayuensis]